MATVFNYTISTDTLNGAVAAAKLTAEIRANAGITIALDGVSVSVAIDDLAIEFRVDLPASEVPILDAIVAAHDGNPGLNDASRFQIVGADQLTPADVFDDGGVKKIGIKLDDVLTGPAGPQGPPGNDGNDGADGAVGPAGPPGPTELVAYVESEAESSTTSGSYQTKTSLAETGLNPADYFVEYTCEVLTTDDDMNVRFLLEGVTVNEFEHTRAGGDEASKQFYQPQTGFKRVTITGSTLDASIQWNNDGGGTARIRRARIVVWKVT